LIEDAIPGFLDFLSTLKNVRDARKQGIP